MNKYRIEFEDVNKHLIPQGLSLPHWLKLVERATKKKPKRKDVEDGITLSFYTYICPNCDGKINRIDNIHFHDSKDCGQALDWSNNDE